MTFYKKLINLLKKDLRFVDEQTGELLRNEIVNETMKNDFGLISLLLEDEEVKRKFFLKIRNHFVFQSNDFISYIEKINLISDSYTKYKNKIGLNINNKYLNERNEISLVWPFKDCVLEGGMSKEDDKRNEIFFNETLAEDEIDRLLDPKVIVNFSRYSEKGIEKITKFDTDELERLNENILIKGNNLLASHSLKEIYRNRIKLVYLDPPYNAEGENNTFSYNNNFNHSSWLTFMKNRIEITTVLVKFR